MRIPKFQELEKDVEAHLRNEVLKLGGKAYKFVSPANRSVPDRIIIMPGGRVIFVEVKTTKGKLTKGQEREIKFLADMGCSVFTVYGKKEVDEIIRLIKNGRI